MATGILRPNGTVSNGWSVGDHTRVDEGVTQPAGGNGDWLSASQVAGDDNDVITMSFPTISGVFWVTNITIWTNGCTLVANKPELDVLMPVWLGYTDVAIGQSPVFTWTSRSINGAWTQAHLNALQVRYRADVPAKIDGNSLDVVYVYVTYTPVPTGYGHDFIGVPAANISSAIGVPTANIANIKGV